MANNLRVVRTASPFELLAASRNMDTVMAAWLRCDSDDKAVTTRLTVSRSGGIQCLYQKLLKISPRLTKCFVVDKDRCLPVDGMRCSNVEQDLGQFLADFYSRDLVVCALKKTLFN